MPPAKPINAASPCPCGSHLTLGTCCLNFIKGVSRAPTAEALMRSRYTAHVLIAVDYLWETWSPEIRIRSSKAEIAQWASSCEWLRLTLLEKRAGDIDDHEGWVSFVAIFRDKHQRLQQHHEVAYFKKVQQGWRYIDHVTDKHN